MIPHLLLGALAEPNGVCNLVLLVSLEAVFRWASDFHYF